MLPRACRSTVRLRIALSLFTLPALAFGQPDKQPFDGQLAMEHIAQQVSFGPRTADYAGKQKTLTYIQQLLEPEADQVLDAEAPLVSSAGGRVVRAAALLPTE